MRPQPDLPDVLQVLLEISTLQGRHCFWKPLGKDTCVLLLGILIDDVVDLKLERGGPLGFPSG